MIGVNSSAMPPADERGQSTVLNARSELVDGLRSSDTADRSTDTMQYRCRLLFSLLGTRVLVFVMSMLMISVLKLRLRLCGRLTLCDRLTGAGDAPQYSTSAFPNVASEIRGGMDTIGQTPLHGMCACLVQAV